MADRPGKTISFYTDAETVERLEREAEKEDRSVSKIISMLVNESLDRRTQPAEPGKEKRNG